MIEAIKCVAELAACIVVVAIYIQIFRWTFID